MGAAAFSGAAASSITATTWSRLTRSPTRTLMRTTPSTGAVSGLSIFMASTVTIVSPAATWSPSFTGTATTVPGIWVRSSGLTGPDARSSPASMVAIRSARLGFGSSSVRALAAQPERSSRRATAQASSSPTRYEVVAEFDDRDRGCRRRAARRASRRAVHGPVPVSRQCSCRAATTARSRVIGLGRRGRSPPVEQPGVEPSRADVRIGQHADQLVDVRVDTEDDGLAEQRAQACDAPPRGRRRTRSPSRASGRSRRRSTMPSTSPLSTRQFGPDGSCNASTVPVAGRNPRDGDSA